MVLPQPCGEAAQPVVCGAGAVDASLLDAVDQLGHHQLGQTAEADVGALGNGRLDGLPSVDVQVRNGALCVHQAVVVRMAHHRLQNARLAGAGRNGARPEAGQGRQVGAGEELLQ
ncbi:hypothetical protein [Streptomyces tendae]